MTEHRAELEHLAVDIAAHDGVCDAYAAKSFTDQVLIVEVPEGRAVPDPVADALSAHGLTGANEAYGIAGSGDTSSTGPVGNRHRHRFVDPEASEWVTGAASD